MLNVQVCQHVFQTWLRLWHLLLQVGQGVLSCRAPLGNQVLDGVLTVLYPVRLHHVQFSQQFLLFRDLCFHLCDSLSKGMGIGSNRRVTRT
uniref:Putative secreted protein n=1 Tax=Ixodes ricinus TaxID=34613 RepID=A0A147BUG2_IXORI